MTKKRGHGPNLDKLIRYVWPRLLACTVSATACAAMAVSLGDACPEAVLLAGAGLLTAASAAVVMLSGCARRQARALDRTERMLEVEIGTSERLGDDLVELRKHARRSEETQP
jgi:hypothetical protein